jgi:hypothetical protein
VVSGFEAPSVEGGLGFFVLLTPGAAATPLMILRVEFADQPRAPARFVEDEVLIEFRSSAHPGESLGRRIALRG